MLYESVHHTKFCQLLAGPSCTQHPSGRQRDMQSGRLWSSSRDPQGRLHLPDAHQRAMSRAMDASREHLPAKVLDGVGRVELWGAPVGDVQSEEDAVWLLWQHGGGYEGMLHII